jgi:hypothetical protein
MELKTEYGDYTIIFNSRRKIFCAKDAAGDIIRDGFPEIDKLVESLDNLDKRKEKGKAKAVTVAALKASDTGFCKSVVATSIAATGWRGGVEVWVVEEGSRTKENASDILIDTPENRAALKKLQDAFNVEKASEKNREKLFLNLEHITMKHFK